MKETVQNALVKKAEQIAAASDLIAGKTRDWQTIKQYLSGRLEEGLGLTEEQQRKLDRYQFIYNQLVSGKYTEQEVLKSVMNVYHISQSQAYEDKAAAQEIFVTVLSINKRFEQKIELESAKNLKRKCEALGDMKAAAAFQKNIIALQDRIQEPEEDLSQLYEGHTIEAVFDPTLLGRPAVDLKEVLAAINAKRDVPINLEAFIEDIPHEEVTDGSNS